MTQLRFFIAEAWEYLVRGRGTTLASVIALSAVLFLLALVLLATHNVQLLAQRLQQRKGLTVFLSDGVGPERARELRDLFAGFGEVSEVRLVDREEALSEIETDLGGFPVASIVGENPLPYSLVVSLTPSAAAERGRLQKLAGDIRAFEDVQDVVFGDQWVETLDRSLRTLYTANLAVGGLAAAAVFVVLLTTLRLVFLSRRETVRILKVVGATDRFIRSPFVLLGGIQCALAGGLALVILGAVRVLFETFLPGVRPLPIGWQALFLSGACVLGMIASLVSIEPALRGLETRREDVVR
jgi:cell division transport system permease protein